MQLCVQTLFGLAHLHGNILREGWKNILDCIYKLFRARLLPEVMVQVCLSILPASLTLPSIAVELGRRFPPSRGKGLIVA